MGLSHTVPEIMGDFSQKLQIFPTPVHFAPSPNAQNWYLVSTLLVKKKLE